MSIFEQFKNGIKEAMKAHDKGRLEALRGIKAEFLIIKTAPDAQSNAPNPQANILASCVFMPESYPIEPPLSI